MAKLRWARPRRREAWLVPLALAAAAGFVVLATLDISLPGLYYDELFEVVPSLAFVKGDLPSTVSDIQKSVISVFGHPLALMAQPYNGGLKTIVFIPVAALFGISPNSVRWFTVATSLLALGGYYFFARQLFRSSAVATLTVVLLALDPSFVWFSRVDYGPSTLMFLLKALALSFLILWWRSGRSAWLLLGTFALGLGVYDKTNFLWIVGAIVAAAVVLQPRGVWARVSRGSVATAVAGFVAGALPLIVYNLSWPPRTLAPVRAGTVHLRYGNYQGNVFEQIAQRVRELARLLDGETATSFFGYERYLVVPVLPILAALGVIGFLSLLAHRPTRNLARPGAFVALVAIAIVLEAAFTPGGDKPHHLLLVYPFPHIVVAAAIAAGVQLVRSRRRPVRGLAVALASALVLMQPALGAIQSAHVLDRLRTTGGEGNYSDAVYRLDDYLMRRHRSREIVMLDWGIFYPLVGLSQGRLRCTQLWRELNNSKEPSPELIAKLTNPAARYVVHVPSATNFTPPRRHFFDAVRRAGLRAETERVFRTRRGSPILVVYRLRR